VHLGHQELFRRLRLKDAKPSVLTFDPHPSAIVAPQRVPRLLSTIEERCGWMRQYGIEQVLVVPFDAEFSRLSPREFASRVLARAAGAKAILVGENFRFGSKQAGDTAMLEELGREFGFSTEIAQGVSLRGEMVSSTRIRTLLDAGSVEFAARMLGRPYALTGRVVAGHGVGSKKTVPTLNLESRAGVIPANGVYISETRDLRSDRVWPSVTNIGYRPTFGGQDALSIESFVLEGFADAAPEEIQVAFLRRLREERKFPNAELLKAQILMDAARARQFFRRTRKLFPIHK
jgi:riboflavin kinase/FMN adenylyltransferase